MLSVVGTLALDTLGLVKELARPEATGGVLRLHHDMPGGTGGNVAMAYARLGGACRLHSAVGRDFEGTPYERRLRDAGVLLDGVQALAEPTSRCYVFVDDTGRQVSYFFAGASRSFAAALDAAPPSGRAHFAAGEIARYPALMEACDWVSFDPGQELFHRDIKDIEACFPHVDLLFLNRHEREVLETKAGYDFRRLFDLGIEVVVETRGSEGTLVHTPSGRFAATTPQVKAVDPTGAGDAHRAAFLFALAGGADLGKAARFASVCGSFAVEHVGAQTGHPTLAQAAERYAAAFGAAPF